MQSFVTASPLNGAFCTSLLIGITLYFRREHTFQAVPPLLANLKP